MNCSNCNKEKVILRCTKCKKAYYCNINCQKSDWLKHKSKCTPAKITIVLVSGIKTSTETITSDQITGFRDCVVTSMLGFDIKYKRWAKNLTKPDREIALFLMIDLISGFADAEWQIECGIVAFFLNNGIMTENLFWDLYSYIFHLMDYYASPQWKSTEIQKMKLNPSSFLLYQQEEREIQKKFENDKIINLDILFQTEI